jgi:hypothetical protein
MNILLVNVNEIVAPISLSDASSVICALSGWLCSLSPVPKDAGEN